MKIGIIKFCIPIDFEVLGSTTNSGVDDRYGFFKELISRGHEIIVFTPLVKGTKNNPKEERWITNKDIDIPDKVKFIRNIGYAPGKLPIGENKVDVMICEAGVGNMQFPNHYYGDIESPEGSLIRRFMHVLNAHKGLVIYMHNDPSLPFYFRQMAGRKYPWGHKRNGYTNPSNENRQPKWVRDSAWGTFDEVFKDKKSVVLTRSLPEHFDFMIDNFNSDRAGYKEFSKYMDFEYIRPAYSYDLCDDLSFNQKIEYPLFYSGGDRRRRIAFRKFYEEMGIPTYVSGKWSDEAMNSLDGINFMGWLEDRKMLLEHLNKAGCVVQIQPKDASKMGWWTARVFEAAACKTMGFVDSNIDKSESFVFDDYFVLKNKEDGVSKIRSFLSMSYKDRCKIIETQLAYCKTNFTWKKFTDSFMAICRKHMTDKTVFERTSRKDYKNYIINIDKSYSELDKLDDGDSVLKNFEDNYKHEKNSKNESVKQKNTNESNLVFSKKEKIVDKEIVSDKKVEDINISLFPGF